MWMAWLKQSLHMVAVVAALMSKIVCPCSQDRLQKLEQGRTPQGRTHLSDGKWKNLNRSPRQPTHLVRRQAVLALQRRMATTARSRSGLRASAARTRHSRPCSRRPRRYRAKPPPTALQGNFSYAALSCAFFSCVARSARSTASAGSDWASADAPDNPANLPNILSIRRRGGKHTESDKGGTYFS